MTFYTYLKRKVEDGTIKNLYKKGILAYKVTSYLDVYEKYKEYLNKKERISSAVEQTSIDLKVSDRQVWKIIRFMEDDIF